MVILQKSKNKWKNKYKNHKNKKNQKQMISMLLVKTKDIMKKIGKKKIVMIMITMLQNQKKLKMNLICQQHHMIMTML